MSNPNNPFEEVDLTKLDNLTDAQVKDALKAIELEERRLDLELKREQVAANRAKKNAAIAAAQAKNAALRNFLFQREQAQKQCNHRKGGRNADAIVKGEGSDAYYCIAKHVLPNGRAFVLCCRCGKEWHPANPYNIEDGKNVPLPATEGYDEAIRWPTDNTTSGSSLFVHERNV